MREREMPYGAKVAMDPVALKVAYRRADDGSPNAVHAVDWELGALVDAAASCESVLHAFGADDRREDADFDLRVRYDGELLEVAIDPCRAIVLDSFCVVLRHAFSSEERVLLNGYQSWTDSVERPAWSRMRGLRGVSSRLVERFALDGGGDYAIVDYPAKRGEQHGFTYATFRRGDGMVLVGSLDESKGFTLIEADAAGGTVTLGTECPMRTLVPGRRTVLGRYAIVRGTMQRCYERWFALSGVKARDVKPLVGYASWYRHNGAVDAESLLGDLAEVATFFNEGVPFDISAAQKLFLIDDGYCKVGDWLFVDRQKFPQGLGPIAERIRKTGFMPGLWLAPFVCEKDSRVFRERPEWLLRDASGDPIATGSQWSGGYALDIRNVDVRSYILQVLQTVTRDWGFGLIKVDFLYSACMRGHSGLNRGELMADAIDLLRTGAGEGVLLLGCGVPLASAFGKLDYCRIGCDVGLDWDVLPHMSLLHRERVSTKNSLANTYARAPLDGRAFGNDPDVFFLRRDVRLSDAQRDELLFADADLGSVLLTSDVMAEWDPAMKQRYLEALQIFVERFGDVPKGGGISA